MLAAVTIMGNLAGIQYSFGGALQTGVSTVVGNALGEQRPDAARRASAIGVVLAIGSQALCAPFYWWFRRALAELAELFTSDEAVIELAEGLTPWVMLFCSMDGAISIEES